MTDATSRIVRVILDERTLIHRKPEVEHERAVAIFDLVEENSFDLKDKPGSGPYTLFLSAEDNRLVVAVRDAAGESELARATLALPAFRSVIRDYFLICESYQNAVRRSTPSQIEAIDMGRRGLHDEGSQTLMDAVSSVATIDLATARRLFTLLSVLHLRT